ncbi:MAG TPA: FkbM family methyltransferase [Armatimonadota bacterium]|nr:FkbM family methyltransferase [Armatimonadota bacterium]
MRVTFVNRVIARIRQRLGIPAPWDEILVLGRNYMVRSDAFRRDGVDYDRAWFLACALHSHVIYDVGANTGENAPIAFSNNELKELVMVDANPAALAAAAEMLVHNHLSDRARFVCAFAGDVENSTIRFWTIGTGAAGSMYRSHARSAEAAGAAIEVPTVTLDALSHAFGSRPDFVKIDVEGAEFAVLEGSRRCAGEKETRFLVEMHSNPDLPMRENATRVLRWCEELGYNAWYLARESHLTDPDEIAHRGRCHLLLQPADWSYPTWLRGIPQSAPLQSALDAAAA